MVWLLDCGLALHHRCGCWVHGCVHASPSLFLSLTHTYTHMNKHTQGGGAAAGGGRGAGAPAALHSQGQILTRQGAARRCVFSFFCLYWCVWPCFIVGVFVLCGSGMAHDSAEPPVSLSIPSTPFTTPSTPINQQTRPPLRPQVDPRPRTRAGHRAAGALHPDALQGGQRVGGGGGGIYSVYGLCVYVCVGRVLEKGGVAGPSPPHKNQLTFSPLLTSNLHTYSRLVIVNRGWAPLKASNAPQGLQRPNGRVTLLGVVANGETVRVLYCIYMCV